jgi:hypothetical protein
MLVSAGTVPRRLYCLMPDIPFRLRRQCTRAHACETQRLKTAKTKKMKITSVCRRNKPQSNPHETYTCSAEIRFSIRMYVCTYVCTYVPKRMFPYVP